MTSLRLRRLRTTVLDEQRKVGPQANELVLEDSFSENTVAGVPHPRMGENWTAVIVGAKIDESHLAAFKRSRNKGSTAQALMSNMAREYCECPITSGRAAASTKSEADIFQWHHKHPNNVHCA
jgi:hypothetical protein